MDTPQTLIDRIVADSLALQAQIHGTVPPPTQDLYPKAKTDRVVRPRPTPPTLGAALSKFTDPTYGSRMVRVTDPGTNGGAAVHTPSSIGGAWNSDGSKFVAIGAGGNAMFYGWDGVNVTPLTRLGTPVTIRNQAEPWFSYTDPNLIYANAYNPATGSYRLIKKWDLAAGSESVAVDLDALYPDKGMADGGYVGPVIAVDGDTLVILFGGSGQDSHYLVHHSKLGLIDARTLVAQSNAGPVAGFKMHGIGIDRNGLVTLGPSGADIAAHPGLAQIQVYDPATGKLTPLTDSMKGGGHYQLGYGKMVNQDCCTAGTWDPMQWQIRDLTNLGATKDLINPVQTPQGKSVSDHTSWRNAQAGKAMPILSSLFRYADFTEPWRAWDDEIIAIATDGSGTVYRFCHHQSKQTGDYWDQPVAHIDPTGKAAIFTSNWGKTGRQDVFLVALE